MKRWIAVLALSVLGSHLAAQTVDEYLQQGLRALQARDADGAAVAFESARNLNMDDGRIRLGLAEAYRLQGREEEARTEAEYVAAELAENSPELLRGLSVYYQSAGEPGTAARYEASYTRYFPDDVSGFGRAAAFFLEAGDARNAAEFALSGLERERMASLYDILGSAYAELGEQEKAAEALRQAIEIRPYDEDYRYNLAYLSLRAEQFEEALALFDEARAIFDKSSRIELGRGAALYGLRRFDDAMDAFLRASELAPGAAQPHYFLGRLIEHAGDRIGLIVERQRIFAEAQPASYLGPFLVGQVLLAAGDGSSEEIETLLRRSIHLRGDYWESHFELGQLLERERRYEEAEPAFERAVALNPRSSKPQYRLARVYARLGKKEQAAEARRRHEQLTEAERTALSSPLSELDTQHR